MRGSFVDSRLGEIAPWAAGGDGAAIQIALGNDQNAHVLGLEDTAKMVSPYLCPADALNALGRRFGLIRYPGELDGAAPLGASAGVGYRGRLCNAWDAWQWAGTSKAIVDQLHAYGIVDVAVVLDPDAGYPSPWFSRFDVSLGPDFGAIATTRSVVGPQLATTTGSFVVPTVGGITVGVGATVTVSIDATFPGAIVGTAIYIGQAGYFLITAVGAGTITIQNLGGAVAAEAAMELGYGLANLPAPGLKPGALGTAANMANPGDTIATGQAIVQAYSGDGSTTTGGTCAIVGPGANGTRIGYHLANASDRIAIKAIVLKWKSDHGYPGKIVLNWDNARHIPSSWPFAQGYEYIGRMIGLNFWIGLTPVGGYDRS